MNTVQQERLLELIQRGRAGDPAAQEELVRAVQNKVYYHCKKMLKHEQDAQDAAQDVLITMITSLDKLKEPAAFWGWVNGITANRCRHLLSAPHREWQIPEDEEGDSLLDRLEDPDLQLVPDQALDDKETRRMILDLVDSLPPDQRMSVLFYYYDEMSVKEIAQAMDTSEGTVKSRLNYARKSIRKGVEEHERRGVKLYSVSPILLLVLFLRQEAEHTALDGAAASAMAGQVMSHAGAASAGTQTGTAAGSAATAGSAGGSVGAGGAAAASKGLLAGLSARVIAAAAAVLVVGGVAAGVVLSRDSEAPDPAPSSSVGSSAERPDGSSSASQSGAHDGSSSQAEPQPPQEEAPDLALVYGVYGAELQAHRDLIDTYASWYSWYDGLATVALADVYGDSTPELIFVEASEAYPRSASYLRVFTYADGQAVSLLNTSWDFFAGSMLSYTLFQAEGDKTLYASTSYYTSKRVTELFSFAEGVGALLQEETNTLPEPARVLMSNLPEADSAMTLEEAEAMLAGG